MAAQKIAGHSTICPLVKKLAAAQESNVNSVNVIPPRQGRRPECMRESAGVAKEIGNKIYQTGHCPTAILDYTDVTKCVFTK